MSCCGQKRRQWQEQKPRQETAPVDPKPVLDNPVKLTYVGQESYLVKGKQTGLLYLFAPMEPGLEVDGRDVKDLLAGSLKLSLSAEAVA
jgi:hypothetical protein